MEMCVGVNSDTISNLPANVIDQILIRLPIIDVVRTSVLSTKWRYKWTTITELVFRDMYSVPYRYYNKDKLINIIDRVFLLHSGFIHKFELSTMCLRNYSTIDCWILFLSRKNIKELVLKFPVGGAEKYKLPTCFFSAQQICTLELHRCVLKSPPTFTGFSKLKSLHLEEITFNNGGLECLISKCPVLERLTLVITDRLDHLNICSPNLKYLFLKGTFQDFCFENTPLLSDVSIHMSYTVVEISEKFLQSETGNAVKILSSLPNLKKLATGLFFLEFLAVGKIPAKLPFTCHHLNKLSLHHLNFKCVKDICVTLCLLNSSPNLRVLEIESWPHSECEPARGIENFWEERTHIDWNMSGLQIVKITAIEGLKRELEFIRLLLASSPMLEMLSIISACTLQGRKRLKFLKELLIFPRASPKAKIFLEYDDDE